MIMHTPLKTTLRNLTIAALTASTLVGTTATPALAGKGERAFLAGVLATVAVGALITANGQPGARSVGNYVDDRADDRYAPVTRRVGDTWRDDRRTQDRYRQAAPAESYRTRHPNSYSTSYSAPAYPAPTYRQPTAQAAFADLSYQDRRMVQQRLALLGYYGYGIDGLWGPGTDRALRAFARDHDVAQALDDPRDARRVYQALLTN
jgi:hypothetical protein